MAEKGEFVFGKIAISHKFMTPGQLNECLDIQQKMRDFGLEVKKIGQIAVERGFITEHQLKLILNIQSAVAGQSVKEAAPQEQPATMKAARPSTPIESMPRPAPVGPLRQTPAPAPSPVREELKASAPAPRSRVDSFISEVKMKRAISLVLLIILGLVGIILVASITKKSGESETTVTSAEQSEQREPDLATQNKQIEELNKQSEERAEEAYQSIKQFAKDNPSQTGEIVRRCKKLMQDFPGTLAAEKASALASVYSDLPAPTTPTPAAGNQQAAAFFQRLSLMALQLRSQGQLAKAIEVYDQFPDAYKETEFYEKVQSEKAKLRALIAEKYDEDLRKIDKFMAEGNYDAAKVVVKEIENYAFRDLVKQVTATLESYINEAKSRPREPVAPVPAPASGDAVLEKLRIADFLYDNNLKFEKALELYNELVEMPDVISVHPEIALKKKDLERVLSVLDAAAQEISESKGRRRTLYLEKSGSISGTVDKVENREVTLIRSGGNETVAIEALTTSSILTYARKLLPRDNPETYLSTGLFLFARGQKKEAEKEIYEALKRGTPEPEIRRILGRLSGKPTSVEPPPEIADTQEADKLFEKAKKEFDAKDYAKAFNSFKELITKFPKAPIVEDNRDFINEAIKTCETKISAPYSNLFNAKILSRPDLGKEIVEVIYDFSDPAQLKDWKEYNWYSIFDLHDSVWELENEELSGTGSHGFLWKGVLNGDVKIEFDAYSTNPNRQNIQATICDDGAGSNYLFALGLTELGPSVDVIRFNEKFAMGKTINDRRSSAKSFQKYHIKIIRSGNEMKMYVDDRLILQGEHNSYKKGHIGLFAIGSKVRFDNVSIVGKLDTDWLRNAKGK